MLPCGGFIQRLLIAETVLLHCRRHREVNDGVGEILGESDDRRKNLRESSEIPNSELGPFGTLTEYGDRGPNLAVSFLKRRIPLNKNEQSENRAYSGGRLESG